jgi:hypothetical protein
VKVESDLPADLPPVNVPPHRLTQAVLNLVVNAGEAIAGEGLVKVVARTLHPGALGQQVQLSVSDNGEGMPPEVRSRALDPFFTTKKRGIGTGLGLSLVQGVMVSAGGKVEIESRVGHGTCVTLTMPAPQMPDAVSLISHRAEVSLRDPRAASFVAALLQSAGYEVQYGDPSHNGRTAPSGGLWITEPSLIGPQSAKRWLRADRRRRVILFSPRMDEWAALGVLFVTDTSDFNIIRRTLAEALQSIEQADDDGP